MVKFHPLIQEIFESSSIPIKELEECSSRGVYLHTTTKQKYFTKVQNDVKQMKGEIEGLKAMYRTTSFLEKGLVPKIIGFKVNEAESKSESAMITQYFELGSSPSSSGSSGYNLQRELGEKLAKMHHSIPQNSNEQDQEEEEEEITYNGKYGFNVPTHCGITEQDNTYEENWETFYRDRRLGNLVKRINDNSINKEWELMKEKAVPLLLHSFEPSPKPVILHGDLWSGNKGYDTISKTSVIFDPASYYGHNEADLGITHMFGGFTNDFYEAYHKVHPKSKPYYDERQKLYELYHHLNHTLMFGGSYKSGSLSIMRSLNEWAKDKEL
ncbi:uncharacterized protein L201_008086 [Kwoniella dendrophila CBS 6074]|uniref:protein-ribulosamine 3-kinase n=1 Tax=Kwoniella dendrophila CBS 6074 TaxID=1295534 RepID=A0AAX4K6X7_9TREE